MLSSDSSSVRQQAGVMPGGTVRRQAGVVPGGTVRRQAGVVPGGTVRRQAGVMPWGTAARDVWELTTNGLPSLGVEKRRGEEDEGVLVTCSIVCAVDDGTCSIAGMEDGFTLSWPGPLFSAGGRGGWPGPLFRGRYLHVLEVEQSCSLIAGVWLSSGGSSWHTSSGDVESSITEGLRLDCWEGGIEVKGQSYTCSYSRARCSHVRSEVMKVIQNEV